jgi:hypothetical protein
LSEFRAVVKPDTDWLGSHTIDDNGAMSVGPGLPLLAAVVIGNRTPISVGDAVTVHLVATAGWRMRLKWLC